MPRVFVRDAVDTAARAVEGALPSTGDTRQDWQRAHDVAEAVLDALDTEGFFDCTETADFF